MGVLDGRVALVTGARGGIGLATARALAAEGAKLVLGDVASLDETIRALEQAGAGPGDTVGVKLDVTSAADAEAAVSLALERFGRLDILVNNAGVGKPAPLAEVTDELWDWIIDINLKGAFICARAAAPKLGAGGSIVNIASLAGRASSPSMACAYSASKAGLLGLTRHLAKELAPRGIRVNAVNPGLIDTAIHAKAGMPDRTERFRAVIPMGRAGSADEVARVILWLLSDEASYVTGALVPVGGGR